MLFYHRYFHFDGLLPRAAYREQSWEFIKKKTRKYENTKKKENTLSTSDQENDKKESFKIERL